MKPYGEVAIRLKYIFKSRPLCRPLNVPLDPLNDRLRRPQSWSELFATVGNRNTTPRTSGHYNDNVITAASNDTYQCESNSRDSDYYFGDYDGYFSNDNYIDNNNNRLTEAKNLIYAT